MKVRELKETEDSVEPTVNVDEEAGPEPSEKAESAAAAAAFDVSGKSFDFFDLEGVDKSVEALFMYKNFFNLIPRAVGSLKALKTLKFFGNELNLFPGEVNELAGLECLQVKAAAAPGLGGLDFGKLKALKELELSRVPIRPSAIPVLSEITGLKSLTKLSVCHFSIRYLPPEIGQLNKLEYLDLSFNKMKNLPTELTLLDSLLSLEVTNNKLVELPSGLSSLKRLENLDLSNNRLTSFECLELESMRNLQKLNLQNNKLRGSCQTPSWICCSLEGNGNDFLDDEFISSDSSTEMDVVECVAEKANLPKGSSATSSHSSAPSSSHKCISARKSKGWKRQRARHERLNSRKWKVQNHTAIKKAAEACLTCTDELLPDGTSSILFQGGNDENLFSEADEFQNSVSSIQENDLSAKRNAYEGKCTCDTPKSLQQHEVTSVCTNQDDSSSSVLDAGGLQDDCLDPDTPHVISKSKRHFDAEPDNQKPRKCRRPTGNQSDVSCKYSMLSHCSIDDYLSDGFYDAGRDRPFMPLSSYEEKLPLFSREVILLDRERDEKLDVIALCAQALVSRFRKVNGSVNGMDIIGGGDPIHIASLLALFVSDHFGGSDKSAIIQKTRKAVSGSNYGKPFVCTCPTGNDETSKRTNKDIDDEGGIVFNDLCERGLQYVKGRLNSIVVPIGSLQFGVCRHRALLLKYLCDRIEPPIDCELVRGFLDFTPHAWNVIVIKRGQSWVRMIVDACHPDDIREETDPEYFSRYIPLSRMSSSVLADNNTDCSTLSVYEQIGKTASNTILECKIGSHKAAAKVRTLEVSGTSPDDIRSFELSCLAEVRIMSSLRHSGIVEYYGHQIYSKWVSSSNGKSDVRILQSAIFMEYIEGGSLKIYLEKLKKTGAKHVPVFLALLIARGIAFALAELHDRHIIHRDIKSDNVLIDLDEKKDTPPVVKLSDFDRAVPLRASLHSCCIAHTGVPPPNVCVGTPRWIAPEVFSTMTESSLYGLEVDIWSFGCLLGEMLTLQVPYSDLSEPDIHDHLKRGKRPKLTKELEELVDSNGGLDDLEILAHVGTDLHESENGSKVLKFLVYLYHWCTESDPRNRPNANKVHKLLADASMVSSSSSLEQD